MTQSNTEEPFTRCSHLPRCRGGKSRPYPPLLTGNGSCKDPDPQKKKSPEVHKVLRAKGGLRELKAQGGCNRDPLITMWLKGNLLKTTFSNPLPESHRKLPSEGYHFGFEQLHMK